MHLCFLFPAAFVLDAFLETIDAGIKLIVVVPEHIPVRDVMKNAQLCCGKRCIRPRPDNQNLSPGKGKWVLCQHHSLLRGRVGIISRSGTLSYEFAGILSEVNVGQSTVVGMGTDPGCLEESR